ncbi:hypothetical protein HZS_5627 [Henneguya salminicola]|nr:hypothetical protein HZS_5627 [Henneguya salminicola]
MHELEFDIGCYINKAFTDESVANTIKLEYIQSSQNQLGINNYYQVLDTNKASNAIYSLVPHMGLNTANSYVHLANMQQTINCQPVPQVQQNSVIPVVCFQYLYQDDNGVISFANSEPPGQIQADVGNAMLSLQNIPQPILATNLPFENTPRVLW